MRVAAWVPEPLGVTPGQRFRIEQWEPYLLEQGIEISFIPFAGRETATLLRQRGHTLRKALSLLSLMSRRLRVAAALEGFDLVYVFRETALIGPALVERVFRTRKYPFVYDFDDAVWIRYVSPTNSYWSYLRFPGKTATSCRLAHQVMAGNDVLADYAQRHTPQVSVVPTTIDTRLYEPPPWSERQTVTVGWTGSHSTAQYLEQVRPVLRSLRRGLRFRFVAVGAQEFDVEGVETEVRPWRPETEVRDLSDFDIGIMPLPDGPWERGKCGLKALQYMALGVPAVVSPVGVNRTIVTHGQDGFHAASLPEWEHALRTLLLDAALRRELGKKGRSKVERLYSAEVQAPRIAQLFRKAALRGPTPPPA